MADKDRWSLKKDHVDSAENFTNEFCEENIDALKNIQMPDHAFKFSRLIFEVSRKIDSVRLKLDRRHPMLTQFKDFPNS